MKSTCFAVFSVSVLLCSFVQRSEAQDHASISRLLETVLKIQPPVDIGFDKSRVRTPDHMMDFYHQFSNAYSPDHLNDNIIRNIFPLQDNGENFKILSNLMIFNLSCVQPGEAVYSAQLNLDPHDFILHPHHKSPHPHKHIFRRKLPLPPPPLQLRVFRLSDHKPIELGLKQLNRDVTTSKPISIDVTALLLDAIASSAMDTREILLAVRLEAINDQPLTPKMANMTHRAASFLIVFSEENNFRPFPLPSLHKDLLASMLNTTDADNEIPQPRKSVLMASNEIPQTTEKVKFRPMGLMVASDIRKRLQIRKSSPMASSNEILQTARQSLSNEIPQTTEKLRESSFRPRDVMASSEETNEIPQTTQKALRESSFRPNHRDVMASSEETNEIPQTTQKSLRESSFRPPMASIANASDASNDIPQSTGKPSRKEQLGLESNDIRVRRSLKDNELTDEESEEERNSYYVFPHKTKTATKRKSYKSKSKGKPHLNDHVIGRRWQDCRRKRLTVNFADIGWGEWVLSPQAFEAYYCDGACSYPLIRSMRPTNHATLQSMVRAVGGQDVPEPRCVADSLSPVTLLYIDQVGNIVLKNYPAMSVRSCACR